MQLCRDSSSSSPFGQISRIMNKLHVKSIMVLTRSPQIASLCTIQIGSLLKSVKSWLHRSNIMIHGRLTQVLSNHITVDLTNILLHSDCNRGEHLDNDNGNILLVTHIGSTSISTNFIQFKLIDILHVPAIYHNLLSLNQFTKDNKYHFILINTHFL